MSRAKPVGWIVLIALLLIVTNLIPIQDYREPNLKKERITASAAMMQVDGLLRDFSQMNFGYSEGLVRANSVFFARGFWMQSRLASFLEGSTDRPAGTKMGASGYFVAVMVIGLFFAFFQSSRSTSGLDDTGISLTF